MSERSTHTNIQNTTKTDTIWPAEWPRVSKKQKQEETGAWDEEETRLQDLRQKRGLFDVSSEDTDSLTLEKKLEKMHGPFNAVYS